MTVRESGLERGQDRKGPRRHRLISAGGLRCSESSSKDSPEIWNSELVGDLKIQRCHLNHLYLDGRIIPEPQDKEALPGLQLNQTEVFRLEFVHAFPSWFDAEGLQFTQLLIPGNDYRTFLRRTKPFFKATYVRFESWLRDRGEEAKANAIYRDRRNRDHKEGGMSWANIIFENVLLRPIGYGTRTYLLFCWWERSISFGSRGDPCCSRKCLPLKMIPASRLVVRT